jgi:hypothetical protein
VVEGVRQFHAVELRSFIHDNHGEGFAERGVVCLGRVTFPTGHLADLTPMPMIRGERTALHGSSLRYPAVNAAEPP